MSDFDMALSIGAQNMRPYEYLWYCLNLAPFALGISEKRIPPHDRALVS